MIVILAVVIGGLVGFRRARMRGGNGFDLAQYTAVHAIAFGLMGLFATLIIGRMM
ncbi:hypothetical protein [Phaeovulum sp.]|uniref:hypothetical protein n=1 Tax=Phaeovulum sp. TaxID=2934796 RepID=UPI0039E3E69D